MIFSINSVTDTMTINAVDASTIVGNAWIAGLAVFGLVYGVWLIHLWIGDASIIDLVWGAGFGFVATVLFSQTSVQTPWKVIVMTLPLVWSVRYTTFIIHRNIGHGEDERYTMLRQKIANKGWYWPLFSFVGVYTFQASAMLIVASPLIIAMGADASVTVGALTWLGMALWLFGFLFEAIGDLQLELFKKKHRGYDGPYENKPVLDTGLWRYTRHPNYFGNACMWWGIGVIVCATPHGWMGLIGPAFMNFALVYLTGKANNERKMKARPAYQRYMETTSGFFPLPSRGKTKESSAR